MRQYEYKNEVIASKKMELRKNELTQSDYVTGTYDLFYPLLFYLPAIYCATANNSHD